MTLLACLISAIAALCVYLPSPHQRLFRAQFGRGWRAAGLALGVAGIGLWMVDIGPVAAMFASLSVWMTAWVLLPYLSWARGARLSTRAAGPRVQVGTADHPR